MKKGYKEWSRREELTLLEMRKNGYTYPQIGKVLNRSAIAIQSHDIYMKRRDGTYEPSTHHTWNNSELREVREMYANGAKCRDIAERYGVTKWAVYSQLAKMRKEGECEKVHQADI